MPCIPAGVISSSLAANAALTPSLSAASAVLPGPIHSDSVLRQNANAYQSLVCFWESLDLLAWDMIGF
ncbi:MAG: hypothetical protein WCC17_15770 [Candidatus Nitrosopolaris sp.]